MFIKDIGQEMKEMSLLILFNLNQGFFLTCLLPDLL